MKNKWLKGSVIVILGLLVASPVMVSASSWYGSHITLPRAGQTWWATTTRRATSNVQGLKASKNAYEVVGNIANTGNHVIGNWKTFKKNNNSAQYVTTYAKGASIKGVFQTNRYNFKTTTAYLEWRP